MVNNTRIRPAPDNGHVQRFKCQGRIEPGGDGITDYPPRKGVQDRRQIDEAGPDANIGYIGKPHLVQAADIGPFDEIGIPGEAVFAVGGLRPVALDPAEQIALSHQPQHPLVVYWPLFPFQLLRYPPVTIAWKLKTNSLNAVYEVRLRFHPIGIPGFASAVEGAPGEIHELTPPPDAADEGPPPGDDFPFLRG